MSTSQTINGNQHYLPASDDAEFGGVLASLLAGLAYKQLGHFVFFQTVTAGGAAYMSPGYGAGAADAASHVAPCAGRIVGTYARCRVAPTGQGLAFEVRKNGSIVIGGEIAIGETSATSATAVSFSAGDTFYAQTSSGHTGGDDASVVVAWAPA